MVEQGSFFQSPIDDEPETVEQEEAPFLSEPPPRDRDREQDEDMADERDGFILEPEEAPFSEEAPFRETPAAERKPMPFREPMPEPLELSDEDILRARARVGLRLRFWGIFCTLLVVNGLFVLLNYMQPLMKNAAGRELWFIWPIIVSAIYVLFAYVRIYMMDGRDLRTVIDEWVSAAARREATRRSRRPY